MADSLRVKRFSRPTLHDVAERAGVSIATVSRVLNGAGGVGTETAAKVSAAVEALNYQANGLASSLRRRDRSTATIGLILADVANPFYSALTAAAEEVAVRNGSLLITASSNEDPLREQRLVEIFVARRVDGLLICPTGNQHALLMSEAQHGTRTVFLDRPPSGFAADVVLMENRDGSRRLVQYLLRRGHRRIGLVGYSNDEYTSAERLEGCREALTLAELPIDADLTKLGCFDDIQAAQATEELLEMSDPPTAIFAYNNRTALGVLHAVKRRKDTAEVVCFDDLEYGALLDPPVTVSAHNPSEMGRLGAELLFARLGGDSRPAQTIVLRSRLIVRR